MKNEKEPRKRLSHGDAIAVGEIIKKNAKYGKARLTDTALSEEVKKQLQFDISRLNVGNLRRSMQIKPLFEKNGAEENGEGGGKDLGALRSEVRQLSKLVHEIHAAIINNAEAVDDKKENA